MLSLLVILVTAVCSRSRSIGDPLARFALCLLLPRIIADPVLKRKPFLKQEFCLFRSQFAVQRSLDQSAARLDVARLGDLVNVDVPEIQSAGSAVEETLKHGLAALNVVVLAFEDGNGFEQLDICSSVHAT